MKACEIVEREILDGIKFKEGRTFKQYQNAVKRAFLCRGYSPILAHYDEAGNCTICGESGRCAGWHLYAIKA